MYFDPPAYPSTPSFGSTPSAPSSTPSADHPANLAPPATILPRKINFKVPLQKPAGTFGKSCEPDSQGVSPHPNTNAAWDTPHEATPSHSAPSKVEFKISLQKQVRVFDNPLEPKVTRTDALLPTPSTSKIALTATGRAYPTEIQSTLASTKGAISVLETAVSDALAKLKTKLKAVPEEPYVSAKPSIKPDEPKSESIEGLTKAISAALSDTKATPSVVHREVPSAGKLSYKVVVPEWLLPFALRGALSPPTHGRNWSTFQNNSSLGQPNPFLARQAEGYCAVTPNPTPISSDNPSEASQKRKLKVSHPAQPPQAKVSFKISATKQTAAHNTVRNALEPIINGESKFGLTRFLVAEPKFRKVGGLEVNQEAVTHAPSSRVEERSNGALTSDLSASRSLSKSIYPKNQLEILLSRSSTSRAAQLFRLHLKRSQHLCTKIEAVTGGLTAADSPLISVSSKRITEKKVQPKAEPEISPPNLSKTTKTNFKSSSPNPAGSTPPGKLPEWAKHGRKSRLSAAETRGSTKIEALTAVMQPLQLLLHKRKPKKRKCSQKRNFKPFLKNLPNHLKPVSRPRETQSPTTRGTITTQTASQTLSSLPHYEVTSSESQPLGLPTEPVQLSNTPAPDTPRDFPAIQEPSRAQTQAPHLTTYNFTHLKPLLPCLLANFLDEGTAKLSSGEGREKEDTFEDLKDFYDMLGEMGVEAEEGEMEL